MPDDNPYRQPAAGLIESGCRELPVHEPVGRPARHGYDWLADAWALFRCRPFGWMGSALLLWLVVALVNLVFMFIPFVGSIVPTVLSPVFAVGLLHMAHGMDRGEGMTVGEIFAGFRRQTGALLGLGGLTLLLVLVFMVLMMVGLFVIFGGDLFNQISAAGQGAVPPPAMDAAMMTKIGLAVFCCVTLMMLMVSALWFAPALVYFGEVHPVRALLHSLGGVLRNIPAMTLYSLALIGFWLLVIVPPLSIFFLPALLAGQLSVEPSLQMVAGGMAGMVLAMITLIAGQLVVAVVAVLSIYTAFRDIFIAPRKDL